MPQTFCGGEAIQLRPIPHLRPILLPFSMAIFGRQTSPQKLLYSKHSHGRRRATFC